MRVSAVAKTIVAAVGAGVTAATVAMGDDVISSTEAINVVLAVLTALGVYVVPNGDMDAEKASSVSELDDRAFRLRRTWRGAPIQTIDHGGALCASLRSKNTT